MPNERNPAYQFIPTDTDALTAMLVGVFEKLTGTTVQPSSPERQYIQWVAHIILQERVLNNYTGNQNIPSRAEGENLDALAELTHIQSRPAASPAACTVRFQIAELQGQAILIPAGTRVTDIGSTLVWETAQDHYIPAGEGSIEVPVYCQSVGTAGNGYAIGQISRLVDTFAIPLECANITVSDGGANETADAEFYELMRASMDGYSCAGARGGYIYFAKQVSPDIADIVANSPTPGVVKLYVLMKGGTLATEEMKNKVLAACSADEVRPLTDWVSVEDAEVVPYDIQFTYYVHGHSSRSGTEIAAAVQAAVEEYIQWQGAKLGRDINPSYLTGLLMQTGIKRVELAAPAFTSLRDGNLALRADFSYDAALAVPQLARVNSIQIRNGGYEDE